MTKPRISVLMPVYNGERYIAEALQSALSQQPEPSEIIVVDDGSTDGSAVKIAPYLNRITYISQENKGIAGAYNRGLMNCHGDFISFLEQDDVWLPGKLEREVDLLRSRPSVGMAYSRYFVGDQSARVDPNAVSRFDLTGRCFAELFRTNLEGPTILPFSAVCVCRAALDAIGPFDSRLKVSVDYSTWLRIAYRFEIGRIDQPGLVYRQHDSNSSKDSYKALKDDALIVEEWQDLAVREGLVSSDDAKQRLGAIYEALAFACCQMARHAEERYWRLKLAQLSPASPDAWARLGASLFSPSVRRRADWYLRRLLGRNNNRGH